MIDVLRRPATEISALIKSGEVSTVEVVQQALNRADEVQAQLNPFVTIAYEAALKQAREADKLLRSSRPESLPALFGVPFTVKDLLDTEGIRTTYGSCALDENVPDKDIVAVSRMKAAGAILLGKTTTPEFASKVTTDSLLSGITRNPWSQTLSPGGSSGGDCVAVVTGVVPFGVSTDGGGSSRIPASTCGILGMKVTIGAIPHESWPFHYGNNSSISMNCRHPIDLASLFNTMSGAHRFDPWSRRQIPNIVSSSDSYQSVSGKRALFIPTLGGNIVDDEYLAVVQKALEQLKCSGLQVDVALDDPTQFNPDITTKMMVCNLAARVRKMPKDQQERLGPVLRGLLDEKQLRMDGVILQSDAISRSQTYDRLEHLLDSYDFIFSATLTAAPPLADPDSDQDITINGNKEAISRWWTHLSISNLTGHPSISIPCGTDSNNLPVGLHAIGGWDREQDLVTLACEISTFYDWTKNCPLE